MVFLLPFQLIHLPLHNQHIRGGEPISFDTECCSINSDISTLIIEFSVPNKLSAKLLVSSVLPTPVGPKNKKLQIESTKFLNSIKNINPAVDTASPKYELNGSLLDIKDYGYNFVATDTRRLAIIEYKSQSVDTLSLIIPKKAINEISKLFIDNFEIYHNSTHLIIKNDEYTFYTKLINGKYPDYEKIIPKDFKYKIALPKDKIIDALQFVKSLANNIKITFKPNEMLFESLNEESGEASTQLEIQTGIEFLCLGINSKYILDFLSQIDGNEFTLCINEPNTPFVVVNGNFSTVIMPVIL